MSLREYQKKRDFQVTSEPAGGQGHGEGRSFVVQKHDASRLHYDFRLEMEGVLKSWAVPKGFPVKKGERRLAVQVEDHPLDYAGFEGIIPQGQYGGGTVMVWDFGRYASPHGEPLEGLVQGKLNLLLEGEKLHGEWTLVRSAREGDEKQWFLIKTGEPGEPISREKEEHSAQTGRTLEQIADQQDAVWQSNATPRKAKAPGRTKAPAKPKVKAGPSQARFIEPMKATLAENPPPGDGWIYELKWDGYRALAIKRGEEVELVSRNEKSLSGEFPEIRAAVAALKPAELVLDGEICALDPEGRPSFQLLQAREMGQARPPLYYDAFDLLHLDGHDQLVRPLEERKKALARILKAAPPEVRYSGAIEGEVERLLEEVKARGMEGLIAKQLGSPYQPGVRTKAWLKLKVSQEQEFVIGGYTPPQGTRQFLGALLVGYYQGASLHFAGKVGTGFNQAWLKRLHSVLGPLKTAGCPFVDLPKKSMGRWSQGITPAEMRHCTWAAPKLVCQVRFAEWTGDGSLRQPVFLGLREDKAPGKVTREKAI